MLFLAVLSVVVRAAAAPAPARPKPRRIAALAPSAAEILFALGVESRVVAVSDFAVDLPASKGKERIGGFSPDLERVVALAPDLVIASRDGTDRAAFERLTALRLPVLVTAGSSLDGVLQDVRRIGDAVGEAARAEELVAALSARIRAAEVKSRGGRALRAVVVIWPDPPIVAGPKTFVGDLLRRAGFANAVPEAAGEWPRVTYETLAAWDPDILFRPQTPENQEVFHRAFASDPRWAVVGAARSGRVVALPGNWIERPGPRLVDALERLVEIRGTLSR